MSFGLRSVRPAKADRPQHPIAIGEGQEMQHAIDSADRPIADLTIVDAVIDGRVRWFELHISGPLQ